MNGELQYKISKFFDELTYPFRALIHTVGRFFFWGWTLRNDYDWDYSLLYEMMLVKLKRMHKALLNGNATKSHTKKITKPLKKAIKIGERLVENDYSENYDKVEAKWGKTHMVFDRAGENTSVMRMFNENALNPKDQKQANLEISNAHFKDNFLRLKDRREFFQLISDNIESWWD